MVINLTHIHKHSITFGIHPSHSEKKTHKFQKNHVYSEQNEKIQNNREIFGVYHPWLFPCTEFFHPSANFGSCSAGFRMWQISVLVSGVTHSNIRPFLNNLYGEALYNRGCQLWQGMRYLLVHNIRTSGKYFHSQLGTFWLASWP